MIRAIGLAAALAAFGCGGGSGGSGGSGGTGGGGTAGSGGGGGSASVADLATPVDMTSTDGFCGGHSCSGGQTCCIVGMTPMCMSSCPDGGLSAQCAKPSDCPSATDACCITISNYTPTSVACTAGSACAPSISAQGSGLDRACVNSADCTDNGGGSGLPDCCTSVATGQHVCFSTSILMLVPSLASSFTCP
ncbi:MAG TPA: hypothetical protein VGL86_09780 [Polyangia bacterium]